MTTNNTFKGIDVRQTGNQLVFRAALLDSSGAIYASGTTNLYLFELQSDGSVKTYDWNDNTFKTGTCTTPNTTMTAQTGNNGAYTIGLWTKALSTLSGFTTGAVYLMQVANSSASPAAQMREFQYGSAEGDLVVSAISTGTGALESDLVQWGGTTVGAVPPDVIFFRNGTAQAGAANSITLDSGASSVDNFYQDRLVIIRSGTGANQARFISSYVGSTKVATVRGAWATNPDNTSVFSVLAIGVPSDVQRGIATAGGASTITLQTALGADSLCNGAKIRITGGTGAKQTRVIAGYVNSTRVVTVDRPWVTNPDSTSVYEIEFDDSAALSSTLGVSATVSDPTVFATGTASAGGSTTITLASALGHDSLPVGAKVKIISGTGADQCRVITGYVDSTHVVTVDRAWAVNPDNTSVYALVYDDAVALNSSLGVAGYRCNYEAALTSSAGTDLRVETWLEDQNGNPIAQTAGATSSITFRELGSDVALLTLAPVLDTTTGTFYIDQSTPGFTSDRGYVVDVTVVDAASVTHGPTRYSNVVFG